MPRSENLLFKKKKVDYTRCMSLELKTWCGCSESNTVGCESQDNLVQNMAAKETFKFQILRSFIQHALEDDRYAP